MSNQQQPPDIDKLWIQHQRRNHSKTQSWACVHCPDRKIFLDADELWKHALLIHSEKLPEDEEERSAFRRKYEAESSQKTIKDPSSSRQPPPGEAARAQPEPPLTPKRPLNIPSHPPPARSLSVFDTRGGSRDISMQGASEDNPGLDQPRKRAAVGDGISAGSGSPYRDHDSSSSPPPRRSKARPTSGTYELSSDANSRPQEGFDSQRPYVGKRQLWSPEQDSPLTRASFAVDPSNIASIRAQKSRAQVLQPKRPRANQSPPQGVSSRPPINRNPSTTTMPTHTIYGAAAQKLPVQSKDDSYDIILQPETRPISQEQLVAEVKGIYAGLVMVEAKCIEVDNKQATLAQADPGAQPKLNNEQWQALIALHRTLLHEHHDFFLASQHPSASPALRRLASKYAMPARMWRHGIHSFLELLRHRLPASLDHMLAFIYLAYSMMALLYETVPAFEDTWIECLGDLGRYRMAIEDDDIRDREVWTGVARHWYSKASDKAPTTGRLYHHLAILARPNALQQLFYYSKSLCVVVPFTSARESILTLFEPVLNAENGHYRLPPPDMAFVKAHGLLFTNKNMEKSEPTVKEFLGLLDAQIGRVTRKFMEQGYLIAIANSVAMLGFASEYNKDNPIIRAMGQYSEDGELDLNTLDLTDPAKFTFASKLASNTLKIVLQRIGDHIDVLPWTHVSLFLSELCKNPGAIVGFEHLNLREIIYSYEERHGYVGQTEGVSGNTHTAAHWLSQLRSALQAGVDSLKSPPSPVARQKTRYIPRVPARYYDGVKKMDFELRDMGFKQCAELNDESKLIHAIRRILGPGLSDEQSGQLVEAFIQAYSEFLDYSDLLIRDWAHKTEERPDPAAPYSYSHPPVLKVPEVSAGAPHDGMSSESLLERFRNWIMRIMSLLVKSPIVVTSLYCCHQIKGVAAESTPTATSSALELTSDLQNVLDWFSGERPAVISTGLVFGSTLWYVSGDTRKDAKLLENLTAGTTGLAFYLSMDGKCYPGQLAMGAAFGIYLDFLCVHKQTVLLEKTWAMTFVSHVAAGILASVVVALCNDFEARDDHIAILAARVCLPVTVSASVIWYAFVKRTGVADKFERGDYNRSIFAFLGNLVYNMFLAFMEAMLEILQRQRVRRQQGPV